MPGGQGRKLRVGREPRGILWKWDFLGTQQQARADTLVQAAEPPPRAETAREGAGGGCRGVRGARGDRSLRTCWGLQGDLGCPGCRGGLLLLGRLGRAGGAWKRDRSGGRGSPPPVPPGASPGWGAGSVPTLGAEGFGELKVGKQLEHRGAPGAAPRELQRWELQRGPHHGPSGLGCQGLSAVTRVRCWGAPCSNGRGGPAPRQGKG